MNEKYQVYIYIYIRKFYEMRERETNKERKGRAGEKIHCTTEKVRCLPVPRMHQKEKA
jgi:hypothetical protein